MAFLDNSGDIILDAVLTDRGRELLSSGTGLVIEKYALGDDEINYALFNKAHPSGSAYYDLEILQTPIFEATTQINANINYGLLDFTNLNILYMPEWKQNTKDLATNFALPHQKLYYVAVNQETADSMKRDGHLFSSTPQKVIQANNLANKVIAYELGLDTTEISKNSTTYDQYVAATGIQDESFTVSVNSLFISNVWSLGARATAYANNVTDNTLSSFPTPAAMIPAGASTTSRNRNNYRDYTAVRGVRSRIYEPTLATTSTDAYSVIRGPSTSLVMLNFNVAAGLDRTHAIASDRKYAQYGVQGATTTQAFGLSTDGRTYDYIDTSVYITGNTTGATITIPVRLIRRAS